MPEKLTRPTVPAPPEDDLRPPRLRPTPPPTPSHVPPIPLPEGELGIGTVFSHLIGSQRDVVELTRDVADEMAKINSSIWEIKSHQSEIRASLIELQQLLSTSGFKAPRWMVVFMLILLLAVLVLAGVQVTGMSHREPAQFPLEVLHPDSLP